MKWEKAEKNYSLETALKYKGKFQEKVGNRFLKNLKIYFKVLRSEKFWGKETVVRSVVQAGTQKSSYYLQKWNTP